MRRVNLSLRGQLQLLVISLLIVTVVLVTLVTLRATFNHAQEQVLDRFNSASAVIGANIEAQAEFLAFATETVAKDFSTKQLIRGAIVSPNESTGPSVNSAMSNHQARANADFSIVLDSNRNFVWSNSNIVPEDAVAAMSNGPTALVAIDTQLFLIASTPLYYVERSASPDAFIGLAVALEKVLPSETTDILGADFVIRFDNQVLSSQAAMVQTPEDLPLQGMQPEQLTERFWRGANYLIWFEQVSQFASQNVQLVLLKPYDEAHLSFLSFSTDLLLLVTAIAIVLVIVVQVLSKAVTQPLTRLVELAGNIQRGVYETVEVAPNSQELIALEQAFTAMQESIQNREQDVERLAFTDDLTGLPNRPGFKRIVVSTLKERQHFSAIGLINLDRFAEVNDTIGHDQGDKLIALVAERLASVTNSLSSLAHLSGDEYAILLKDNNSLPLQSVIEQISAAFKMPFHLKDIALDVSASIGIALYPEHGKAYAQLMQNADIALNRCKQTHLDYSIFEPNEHQYSLQRLSLMSQLRQAISNNELQLYVQPKLNLATGSIDSGECLVRWIHPEMGFIAPDEFIPLAEQTGFIRQLTAWVIEQALITLAELKTAGFECCFAVNISAVDLVDTSLASHILELLQRYQLSEQHLSLEITESAVMGDAQKAIAALNMLQKMGLRLSIDDFGTGYSSMAQLKMMPVKELKIDRSFIMGVTQNTDDAAIVNSMVQLAHSLNLEVVAEGVEEQDIIDHLKTLGVTYAQGYHISRPMPAADYAKWLTDYLNHQ